jgi:hypothetical protein
VKLLVAKMSNQSQFNFSGCLSDRRLDLRCEKIAQSMYDHSSAVIQRFSRHRSKVVGSCRFFNNNRVCTGDLIKGITQRLKPLVKGKTVLCIEDTTEFNYTTKQGRIKTGSLGRLCRSNQIGFFAHPTLIVDAHNYLPLGLGSLQLWRRAETDRTETKPDYSTQKLELKESYRWIRGIEQSKDALSQARHKIIIADREADIYPLYTRLWDESTDLLIRMRSDRHLRMGGTIRGHLVNQRVKDKITIQLKADTRDCRSAHKAILQIKYTTVEIQRPHHVTSSGTQKYFTIQVVEVKESPRTVKKGERPIHWLLLTTLPVRSNTEARQVINYYSKRWMIEELFGIIKTRGLNLEDSQLSHGEAIMKLAVLAMDVSVKILQLTKGRENEELDAKMVFSYNEICLLEQLLKRYEGATEKQRNPYRKHSMAWAAWVIGRMGGWMGYKSESPPGNKTMKIGLERFFNTYIGFSLLD